MSESSIKAYLAENPKMTGALFMLMLLLSSVGNAAAGVAGSVAGP
ncbi:hypothetical protein ACFQH3_01180 [Haladaptatus sp. GCM10025707]|nr:MULTISPECIES: hypothetical protein [unclassified Haladaptatus]